MQMSTLASAGDTAHHMGLGSNAGILDGANAEAMAEELSARFSAAREALSSYVFGQRTVVDQVLITLLSGGNGLLVGVPGLAKTRLVDTLGIVLGMDTKRIQFTPDLMPGDIVGTEVLEEADDGRRSFRFIKGPIFLSVQSFEDLENADPTNAVFVATTNGAVACDATYEDYMICPGDCPLPSPANASPMNMDIVSLLKSCVMTFANPMGGL